MSNKSIIPLPNVFVLDQFGNMAAAPVGERWRMQLTIAQANTTKCIPFTCNARGIAETAKQRLSLVRRMK